MAIIGNKEKYPIKENPNLKDRVHGWDNETNKEIQINVEDLIGATFVNPIQDNKVPVKSLGIIPNNKTVADLVNALPEFEIKEDELMAFTATTKKATLQTLLDSQSLSIQNITYLIKLGKGFYGIADTQTTRALEADDFLQIAKESLNTTTEIGFDPEVYVITNYNGLSTVDAINNAQSYVIPSGKDAYFIVSNTPDHSGKVTYRFTGASGTYGLGGTPITQENLLDLSKDSLGNSITITETIPIFVPAGQDRHQLVNSLPRFEVKDNQLYLFNFREQIISSDNKVSLLVSSYYLKKGSGIYGNLFPLYARGITKNDLVLNFKEKSSLTLQANPVSFTQLDTVKQIGIVNSVNASPNPIVKKSGSLTVVEKDDKRYKIISANGSYGKNLMQVTMADLEELQDVNPVVEEVQNDFLSLPLTFKEKITFQSLLELEPLLALPMDAESGTFVNYNGNPYFYNGTQWNDLSSSEISQFDNDVVFTEGVNIQGLLKLEEVSALPTGVSSGTIVNFTKTPYFYNGTIWLDLSKSSTNTFEEEVVFNQKASFNKNIEISPVIDFPLAASDGLITNINGDMYIRHNGNWLQIGARSGIIPVLDVGVCIESIPVLSRIMYHAVSPFCIMLGAIDLGKEVIVSNFSKNDLPMAASSSKIYNLLQTSSIKYNSLLINAFKWYRLRVMYNALAAPEDRYYFIIVEHGDLSAQALTS